ncbi:MAG: glycerol-3-phosphate 1-O-acyltransferase PlsY [Aestuariivita sp.]|nr:glycerol-3-phosphate 1-O-acyltransferase PlsY [Aestuariivita sp.]MCY4203632.1 glycerol-3-phosphate 1-O-acyltransferase PlsY [Aestuariivita sp.]
MTRLEIAPELFLVALVAYLIGSIPFGLVLARLLRLGDPREIGSGNIGATNVLRTGSKLAAFVTLILDAAKGGITIAFAQFVFPPADAQIVAILVVIGHCFPIWLKFQGGKGVATFMGVWLVYAWPVGLACCLTWLLVVAVSRISSLAALLSVLGSVGFVVVFGYETKLLVAIGLAALVCWRHQENIVRLLAGNEPRIGG